MIEEINKRFINAVQNIIKLKISKNQSEIAKNINIRVSTLSDIKHGRYNVTLEVIMNLCNFYNIDLMYILTGKNTVQQVNKLETITENLTSIKQFLDQYPNVFKMTYTEDKGYIFEADLDMLFQQDLINKNK